MAKLLIYGNPNSPLVRTRGLIAKNFGHEIVWLSAQRANIQDVKSYSLPRWLSNNNLLRALSEPFLALLALITVRPDLIHVHFASKGLAALPLAFFKKPIIVTVMGSDIMPNAVYRFPFSLFTKLLLDKAIMITAKSEYMDNQLNKIGNYSHKIRRVTWGIDLNRFGPRENSRKLRHTHSIPEKDFVFYDPRAAKPLYNKHKILSAFASYFKLNAPDATLVVSEFNSDQKYLRTLKDLAKTLEIEGHVRFIPEIDAKSMAAYYNMANVTISLASSDGFPQTIYEALACGSHLILSDLPQYSDLAGKGLNYSLVDPENESQLVQVMIKLSVDLASRPKDYRAGRIFVRQFADAKQQKELVNELYLELLKHGSSSEHKQTKQK